MGEKEPQLYVSADNHETLKALASVAGVGVPEYISSGLDIAISCAEIALYNRALGRETYLIFDYGSEHEPVCVTLNFCCEDSDAVEATGNVADPFIEGKPYQLPLSDIEREGLSELSRVLEVGRADVLQTALFLRWQFGLVKDRGGRVQVEDDVTDDVLEFEYEF